VNRETARPQWNSNLLTGDPLWLIVVGFQIHSDYLHDMRKKKLPINDLKSIESIIELLYSVISGPPGPRNWELFQALFIPGARLIFNGKTPDGTLTLSVLTPAEYQAQGYKFFLNNGFFENAIANQVDQFGTVAHVFSTYESRQELSEKPYSRGINSIQLLNDGTRWWVVNILWDSERLDNPIPKKYLTSPPPERSISNEITCRKPRHAARSPRASRS
jgi:hypothetical protein